MLSYLCSLIRVFDIVSYEFPCFAVLPCYLIIPVIACYFIITVTIEFVSLYLRGH